MVRGEDVPGPHLRHGVRLGRGGPRLGLALPGGLGLGGLEDGGRGGEAPGGRQQQLRVEQPSGELEHDDHCELLDTALTADLLILVSAQHGAGVLQCFRVDRNFRPLAALCCTVGCDVQLCVHTNTFCDDEGPMLR